MRSVKEVIMTTRLREEFDTDLNRPRRASEFRTTVARNEVLCEVCGKTFFVDDTEFSNAERANEHGVQKGFMCDDCEREYQEAAYN